MVYTEIYKILDWDGKKSVPISNMTKKGYVLFDKYRTEQFKMEALQNDLINYKDIWDEYKKKLDNYNFLLSKCDPNDPYSYPMENGRRLEHPVKPKTQDLDAKLVLKYNNFTFLPNTYSSEYDEFLYNYYNIEEYIPHVMINISPKWDKKNLDMEKCYLSLMNIFKNYMKEEWYDEWYYTIESGGSGDHPHLHAVCRFNKNKGIKSCYTHVSKNWKRQILKYAKVEGLEGVILKPGLQSVLINSEELLPEKMDYLREDKKPVGHENKTLNALDRRRFNKRMKGGLRIS